jgi:hypothetical protein
MINAVGYEDPRYIENLLGLLEYYEAILDRSGLVARAGEVRSLKLGFILDLLNAVTIPDGLKANLGSAVLGAWEMKCIDKTLERGEKELKAMRCSIAAVRNEVMRAGDHRSPMTATKLDVAVMFALPLMQSDLREDGVPGIYDLLARVMDGLAARMEG